MTRDFVAETKAEVDEPAEAWRARRGMAPLVEAVESRCTWREFMEHHTRGSPRMTRIQFEAIKRDHAAWLKGVGGRQCVLPCLDLSHCGLSDVNLFEASLPRARFRGAVLTRVNLSHATLAGADFTNAILTDVDLSHATLACANFTGAKLVRVNLEGVHLDSVIGLRAGADHA